MRISIVGVFLLLLIGFYFVPTLIAWSRKKRNMAAIAVLNIFAGWTFVGWVVALVWAVAKDVPPRTPEAY